jgi:hypothetical protein
MRILQPFYRESAALACAMVLFVAACGGDGNNLVPRDVAGTYTAEDLKTTTAGVTTNQLAAGASMSLVLNSDGTTLGRLFMPASTSPAIDASMVGRWTLTPNGDIDLIQDADTFVRDMLFSVSDNTLTGDQVFGTTRIQLVLTKQ